MDDIEEDAGYGNMRVALNKTENSSTFMSNSHMSASVPMITSDDRSSAAPPSGGKKTAYKLYPFRWTMQLFIVTSMITSGFLMVGFSPIASVVAAIYGCNEIIVQVQTLLFLVAFIPGNFIVISVLNRNGLRVTVRCSN
jgi:hypothetical protein